MLDVPSPAVFGPYGKNTGAVAVAVVLHGLIGVPFGYSAVQVIVRLPVVGLSTTWVIVQLNFAPSVTERSSPP